MEKTFKNYFYLVLILTAILYGIDIASNTNYFFVTTDLFFQIFIVLGLIAAYLYGTSGEMDFFMLALALIGGGVLGYFNLPSGWSMQLISALIWTIIILLLVYRKLNKEIS